ncbi:DNA-binding protein [Halobacteriales archaeon QS_4_70_19]|nr:MAG: DNA-binding protein [Halobacteriales archaeon QS_4_70_19]
MWTIAVLSAPVSEMPLTETFDRLSGCRFRVEESAFGADDRTLSMWFTGVNHEELEAGLTADPSVESFLRVSDDGDELLYELELDNGLVIPRHVIQEHGGTVEEAYGTDGRWTFEVRFPDRDALSETADAFQDYGVTMNYQSITSGNDAAAGADLLTDKQREVLQTAIDAGYYEIPRNATLEELAEELDVSHQALSECLRRAQEALVTSKVENGPPDAAAEVGE